ncbi:CRISPR-associated endoribonuclease Cas6 [Caldisalinibacter kiritimatiensis]|uniref:CRISPR associated protein Cas6 C-terminal domain-containing protein n=1 Tax=Caldisalinibacter kiritimatiensis TaxID=1304284 RepID=R1CZ12_9FIRM|nr:CRISPR-associated endoribonuclease Cas6 [Caldisalinibacter kiritimatiensis]EOD01819.1 hypothetical protein L21TH_0091 [Caldisalinibacter kiritimatiensis]
MRLRCTFECDKLPIAYRMMFVSFIKEALKKSSEEYFNNLYNYKNKSNKKTKNFCFAVYLNDFRRENDILNINGNVELNISSPDEEFIVNLYNGMLKIKEVEYKKIKILKKKILLVKEKAINEDKVAFKTLSPIYIKNKNNDSVSPQDDSYEEYLNYIVNLALKNYRGYGLSRRIKFSPLKMNKVVVKEKIKAFTEQTGKEYMYINAYKGTFILEGHKKDLEDIYRLGVGFRRNQGFGMVEVI